MENKRKAHMSDSAGLKARGYVESWLNNAVLRTGAEALLCVYVNPSFRKSFPQKKKLACRSGVIEAVHSAWVAGARLIGDC